MTRTPFLDAHYKPRTWTELQPNEAGRLRRLPDSEQLTLDTYSIDSGRAQMRNDWYERLSPRTMEIVFGNRNDVIWDLELLECDPELIGCGGYATRTQDGLLLVVYSGPFEQRYFLARGQL